MKYTLQKIFIVVFCSVFMLMGVNALVNGVFGQHSAFGLLWGAGFFFIPLTIMVTQLRRLSRFQKMTYEWYKATHPGKVQDNTVSCFACGNSRIHVRALMNRTFHREHFCTQCGKTLYYSPEQS